jgi:hypothetical protein
MTLLGMSFLNQVEMQRSGRTLTPDPPALIKYPL